MSHANSTIHIPITSPEPAPNAHGVSEPSNTPSSLTDRKVDCSPESTKAAAIPPHLDRRQPVLSSPYLKVSYSPRSGYGVVATRDIPHGTKLVVCSGPVACSISREHRREVCAWCFAFEDGKVLKHKLEHEGKELQTPVPSPGVRHGTETHPLHGRDGLGSAPSSPGVAHAVASIPPNSGGLAFCSAKCRAEWENEYGDVGKKSFMALENFMQKRERKKSHPKPHDSKPNEERERGYSDDFLRAPTPDEVESAWKTAQKQAFLIREYRFATSNDIFALEELKRVSYPQSQGEIHAYDCSSASGPPSRPQSPSKLVASTTTDGTHAAPDARTHPGETSTPPPRQPLTKFDRDFLKAPEQTPPRPTILIGQGQLQATSIPSPSSMSPTVKTKATTKLHRRAVHHAQTNPDLDLVSYDTLYNYLTAMLTCYNQTRRANDAASKQILEGHTYAKKNFKVGVDVPPNSFSELFSLYPQLPPYNSVQNLKITIAIYLLILSLDGLPTSLMIGCTCGVDPALMGNIPCMDFISREVIEAIKTRDIHNAFGIREHDEVDANKHAEIMKELEENHKKVAQSLAFVKDGGVRLNQTVSPNNNPAPSHDSHVQSSAPAPAPSTTHATAPHAPEMTDVYYGAGTWTTASFFNHACIENVTRRREGRSWIFEAYVSDPALLSPNPPTDANATKASSSTIPTPTPTPYIPAGTDLCISYIRHLTHAPLWVRKATLRAWGFECRCALCQKQEEEGRMERMRIRGEGPEGEGMHDGKGKERETTGCGFSGHDQAHEVSKK